MYICNVIKKITAYSFLVIANIILLAHTVLPHHHHEQLVCIEQAHCTDDETNHTQNSTEHNHQHDDSNSTTCALRQAAVIPSSQGRILKECDNNSDNQNNVFFIFSTIGFEGLQPLLLTVTTLPEFRSFLTSFVSFNIGLRAPPIV